MRAYPDCGCILKLNKELLEKVGYPMDTLEMYLTAYPTESEGFSYLFQDWVDGVGLSTTGFPVDVATFITNEYGIPCEILGFDPESVIPEDFEQGSYALCFEPERVFAPDKLFKDLTKKIGKPKLLAWCT